MTAETDHLERVRAALQPTYRLERAIGSGGMAVVYLAHDVKHDRQVALKLLRLEIAQSVAAERFTREIRVVARLTHPHILPLLDSGAVEGTPYYVMPFVAGETLRGRLEKETTIPIEEALTLTTEIADALHYAHAAGLVHRDIKPENVLLESGHAVVADFGIARAITSSAESGSVTTAGIVLGSPAYMSPEQASGDDAVDGRSDVYSLATTLYEMLVGTLPFNASTAQGLIASRFMRVAPRVSTGRTDVPSCVDDAIAAALSLEPGDRPASAAAFAKAITGQQGTTSIRFDRTPLRSAQVPGAPTVAVLPFKNLSSDAQDEFLADGITEEVMMALSRIRTLRVAARASSFAFKGGADDIKTIAQRLGVASIIDGTVRRAGNRIRITAQLVDGASGFPTWSERFDRENDDLFALQDDIAHAIASALDVRLFPPAIDSGRLVTGLAHDAYLRGRFALNKRVEAELVQAVAHFEEATRHAPTFAPAYSGLGDALVLLGIYGARAPREVMSRAREAAERALQLDPSLADAHTTLGGVRALYDWDWAGSDDSFQRARALSPTYPTAVQWHAMQNLLPRGRFADAGDTIRRAQRLDPLSPVVAASVGVVEHLSGTPFDAIVTLRRVAEMHPTFAMAHYFLGAALRDAGDTDASVLAYETAIGRSGATPEMIAGLAQSLARRGDSGGVQTCREQLVAMSASRYVSPCLLAQIHGVLGETDAAIAALERALALRDPELVFAGVRSSYASLRGHERFEAIRRQVGV